MTRRILVVDQDPNLISLYRLVLGKQGHTVLGALSGKQCLETLAQTEVDLILLDVLLSDDAGQEILAQLRDNESWHTIPVIIVSSLSRQAAMEGDALPDMLAGYLRKPFPIDGQQRNGKPVRAKLSASMLRFDLAVQSLPCVLGVETQQGVAKLGVGDPLCDA